MKIPKFIIPVTVSLVAFIWGYRGELWFGNKLETSKTSTTAEVSPASHSITQTPLSKNALSSTGPFNVPSAANQPVTPRPVVPNSGTSVAKELPVTDGSGDYAPEDDGETGEEISGSGGMDEEVDQTAAEGENEEEVLVDEDEAGTEEDSSEVAEDGAIEADDIVPEEVQPSKPAVRVQK